MVARGRNAHHHIKLHPIKGIPASSLGKIRRQLLEQHIGTTLALGVAGTDGREVVIPHHIVGLLPRAAHHMRRRIGFTGLECAALGMEHGTLHQQLIAADLDQTDILGMLPIERTIRFFTYQSNVVRTIEMHAVVHTEM